MTNLNKEICTKNPHIEKVRNKKMARKKMRIQMNTERK